MARIAGVNIPSAKRLDIALTYIHGIGRVKSAEICDKAGLPPEKRVHQLAESEIIKVCSFPFDLLLLPNGAF